MSKRLARALLLTLVCLPGMASAAPAQRIISLDLCTDWMLARFAQASQVTALSALHQQYQAPWASHSWPTHDGSLERVAMLAPDLVITGQYNAFQLRTRLKALGMRVEVLELPTSLNAVADYEHHLLRLLGLPSSLASTPVPPSPSASHMPRRLLLLGANGIGTGRGTFENDILERAGWTNYLREQGYIQLDLEQIATDPPEAILWAAPSSQAIANRFAQHPVLRRAVPAKRWLSTDYWRWQCPGPWSWDLVRQLHRWLP